MRVWLIHISQFKEEQSTSATEIVHSNFDFAIQTPWILSTILEHYSHFLKLWNKTWKSVWGCVLAGATEKLLKTQNPTTFWPSGTVNSQITLLLLLLWKSTITLTFLMCDLMNKCIIWGVWGLTLIAQHPSSQPVSLARVSFLLARMTGWRRRRHQQQPQTISLMTQHETEGWREASWNSASHFLIMYFWGESKPVIGPKKTLGH